MKRFVLVILVLLILPHPSFGQTQALSTSKLIFTQAGNSLAEVNGYTYKYYPDTSIVGTTFTVVCTGTASPFTCTTKFPTFGGGPHSLTLSASSVGGESLKSSPFAFVYVVTPSAPGNIRIG